MANVLPRHAGSAAATAAAATFLSTSLFADRSSSWSERTSKISSRKERKERGRDELKRTETEQNFAPSDILATAATQKTTNGSTDDPRILFLGTGSSTGCPKPLCSLVFPEDDSAALHDQELRSLQKQMELSCRTSRLASRGNPKDNKDYRNNPSLLIMHRNNDDITDDDSDAESTDAVMPPVRNVIIDVGKTFREGAIRWMPQNSVRSLDAIVLTHEHADAVFGLDDVRGFQRGPRMWNGGSPVPRTPMPVFLSRQCFDGVKKQFFYLVPKENAVATGQAEGGKNVLRAVSALQYHIIEPFQPFVAAGLRMVPLPVMHGEDFVSLGFAFTVRGTSGKAMSVVYLSDISRMLPETEDYILNDLPPTDVLVIDSLLMNRNHPVHFSMDQALGLAKRIRPKHTFIVGINCDGFPPHDEMNEKLSKLDMNVQLAHDGLVLTV